jgi:hypothetical protein
MWYRLCRNIQGYRLSPLQIAPTTIGKAHAFATEVITVTGAFLSMIETVVNILVPGVREEPSRLCYAIYCRSGRHPVRHWTVVEIVRRPLEASH